MQTVCHASGHFGQVRVFQTWFIGKLTSCLPLPPSIRIKTQRPSLSMYHLSHLPEQLEFSIHTKLLPDLSLGTGPSPICTACCSLLSQWNFSLLCNTNTNEQLTHVVWLNWTEKRFQTDQSRLPHAP